MAAPSTEDNEIPGNENSQDGWYYRGASGRHHFLRGPYSRKEVLSLLKAGEIGPDTPIRWGNDSWRQVRDYLPRTIQRVHKRRRKFRTIIISVCIVLSVVIYAGFRQRASAPGTNEPNVPNAPLPASNKSMSLLRGTDPNRETLSQSRLISLTNTVRMNNGLPVLEENYLLTMIARERLDDMLQKQYFGHISPSGEGASDMARRVGYRYKLIAENIAYGDFLNNEKVLDGWMQSPGHKKNILAEEPQHIGVAVARGRLKGSDTWVAVQIFGLPSLPVTSASRRPPKNTDPSCNPPSEALARDIEKGRSRLSELANVLAGRSEELKGEGARISTFSADPPRTNLERSERAAFIAAHNQKVHKYNELIAQQRAQQSILRPMIDEYNRRVKAYNECRRAS